MSELDTPHTNASDEDDVCFAAELDPAAIDAFECFYRQLAVVNGYLAELRLASQRRDVSLLLLAKLNLSWELLDARLAFLAAVSRQAARVRSIPALLRAITELRRTLACGLAFRRDTGTAGELLAQTGKLAERLHRDEVEITRLAAGPTRPSPTFRLRVSRHPHRGLRSARPNSIGGRSFRLGRRRQG